MKPIRLIPYRPRVVLAVVLLGLGLGVRAAALVDDLAITLKSSGEVAARRAAVIRHIWGATGFPAPDRGPTTVVTNVVSPVKGLEGLLRVDEFRYAQAPGLEGLAHHFVPLRPNRELVVVHHGHACTFDDDPSPSEVGYGLQRTIKALLREGYGVLAVFMPHMRPGDCTGGHEKVMGLETEGSGLRHFLDPVALGLNYVATHAREGRFPAYRAFHMVGLSGGGWTTTVYAAVDPRVRCSFPVAGSIPLKLRTGGSVGDLEQFEPTFYGLAGYPDLYVMGGSGRGRSQVQILVRRDDCCFGQAQHDEKVTGKPYEEAMREYEGRVRVALRECGRGEFRLVIDEVAPSHMISHHAIENVILPELRKAR